MMAKTRKELLLLVLLLPLMSTSAVSQDFSEHASGGTLDESWVYLDAGIPYQDDIIPSATSAAPDADGYVLEFYDRDQSFAGIAAISSTPETWLDLIVEGYVYAYAQPQNGANVQAGLMFRMNPASSGEFGRVFLNFASTAGEDVRVQTYAGGWNIQSFDIPDASATGGWHHLSVIVAGTDHDEVTIVLDGNLIGTKTMAALAPGGGLENAGTVGLCTFHENPSSVVPCYFDAIEVNDLSSVEDWRQY